MKKRVEQPTNKAMNIFLILFLTIGAVLAGLITLFYRTELNTYLAEIKTKEKNSIIRQSNMIKDKFDAIVGDLLFLSRQNELISYLKIEDNHTKQAIETEYIEMMTARKIYDQIRYLDEYGMERVRVNYSGGEVEPVLEEKLQRKFKRYYFSDTFVLTEKEIFVSPLDLNMEKGQVEKPLKPMIRFGTPVFDDSDTKRGIVLINYLASNLLEIIGTRQTEEESQKMLINTNGYWLLHPDKTKEWGFMFKERAAISFSKSFPNEWSVIQGQGSGQMQTKNGLFTFATIYPLQEGFRSSSGSGEPYKPSVKDLDTSEYFWVLMSQIPSEIMTSHTRILMGKLFAIGAGLFIFISYGAWHLALAITKRRIYQAKLVELALYDTLTGLPNRKLFWDKLEEGISHNTRHGRKLGLLYIDLDGFKNVNDTKGHDAGDELLIKVGEKLKRIVRNSDTVARLGGDEFAVILFEIGKAENAILIGEKVVAGLCEPFELKEGTVTIGASVGVAISPDFSESADSLIKYADQAMYKAKAEGKNACVLAAIAHDGQV